MSTSSSKPWALAVRLLATIALLLEASSPLRATIITRAHTHPKATMRQKAAGDANESRVKRAKSAIRGKLDGVVTWPAGLMASSSESSPVAAAPVVTRPAPTPRAKLRDLDLDGFNSVDVVLHTSASSSSTSTSTSVIAPPPEMSALPTSEVSASMTVRASSRLLCLRQ